MDRGWQHSSFLHDLGTPGDAASGVERDTTHLRVSTGSGGTVVVDAGRTVLSYEDDSIVFEAGKHLIDDYFNGDSGALQPLCDALSA